MTSQKGQGLVNQINGVGQTANGETCSSKDDVLADIDDWDKPERKKPKRKMCVFCLILNVFNGVN